MAQERPDLSRYLDLDTSNRGILVNVEVALAMIQEYGKDIKYELGHLGGGLA